MDLPTPHVIALGWHLHEQKKVFGSDSHISKTTQEVSDNNPICSPLTGSSDVKVISGREVNDARLMTEISLSPVVQTITSPYKQHSVQLGEPGNTGFTGGSTTDEAKWGK